MIANPRSHKLPTKKTTTADTAPRRNARKRAVVSEAPMLCNSQLAGHAAAIRALGKQVVRDIIEIGGRLTECKRIAGHGNWLPWLEQEVGLDERTARRFMSVHECFGKSDKLSDLSIGVSSLYLLAAPSTPKEAREKVIERTEAGEHLTHEQVKEIVASAAARREEAEAEPASNAEIGAKQANTGRRRRRKRFGRDARWLSPRVRNIGHSTADDIVRDLMHLAIHSERHIDAEAVVELLDDRTVAHLEGCLEMVRRALDFALQIKTALDRRAADGNGSGFKLIESAHTQPNGDDK